MHRYRLLLTLLALVVLVLSSLLVAGSLFPQRSTRAASPDNWTTYGYNPERSGFNPDETIITPSTAPNLKQLWNVKAGGIISTQPITANGLIYWGSWDGAMHAIKTDGSTAWTTNLGQTPTPKGCNGRTHGVLGTATAATVTINGTATPAIFVGGGSDFFYALNATTGTTLWKTQLAAPPYEIWGSPSYYNGSIYLGISSWGDCPLVQAQIYKMNAATGALQSTYNVVPNGCTGASVWGSVTIDTTNNTLYFSTGNGFTGCSTSETNAVAVVELRTDLSFVGSWQVPGSQRISDGDFGDTPTIFTATIGGSTHRLVGVANKNGIYYALDEANLAAGPVWEDTIAVGGAGPESGQGSIAPSAWDGTNLYIAGGNTTINGQSCQGGLRAVNPVNGAFVWQACMTDGPVLGAVAAVPGVVAVTEGNGLALVAASNGHTLFKKQDTATSGSSQYYGGPAIANGVVYAGNEDGNFFAFGTTGSPTPTPSVTVSPSPTPPPGTVLGQDTFQRANQSFWGTASGGQTWGADANSQNVFSISNNSGHVSNGSSIYNATLGSVAGDSEVLFSGSISSFANANFGAVLRWVDANDLYKGYIDGTNLIIQKRVGGASTNLASVSFPATAGTSYTLRFRVVGTNLSLKAWQTSGTEPANWMVTATDTSLSTGLAGLRMQMASGITLAVSSFQAVVPGTPVTKLGKDTFQRANQTFWGKASDGQTWGAEANSQNVFSIVNNTGQVANGTTAYNAVLGSSASDAEVLFSGSITSFKSSTVGALLRWKNGNNWYTAYFNGTNLFIQKKVAGVMTTLGKAAFPAKVKVSYTVRFRIVGTTLSAKAWQTGTTEPTGWIVTVTDSSLTSGNCGLRIQVKGTSVVTITSFLATAAS